jgi:hypothetical protein
MKYKVGDKVRIRSDIPCGGGILTVKVTPGYGIPGGDGIHYIMEEDGSQWFEDEIECSFEEYLSTDKEDIYFLQQEVIDLRQEIDHRGDLINSFRADFENIVVKLENLTIRYEESCFEVEILKGTVEQLNKIDSRSDILDIRWEQDKC